MPLCENFLLLWCWSNLFSFGLTKLIFQWKNPLRPSPPRLNKDFTTLRGKKIKNKNFRYVDLNNKNGASVKLRN